MGELRINRRRIVLGAGAAGTLGVLLGPKAAFGSSLPEAADQTVAPSQLTVCFRFDFVQIIAGLIVPGVIFAVAPDGEEFEVRGTGSGGDRGGGEFAFRRPDGTLTEHGPFVVTGLAAPFLPLGGNLLLGVPGMEDGIGNPANTTGGILTVAAKLLPSVGAAFPAVLTIICVLPGSAAPPAGHTEGVIFEARGKKFIPNPRKNTMTLFHH